MYGPPKWSIFPRDFRMITVEQVYGRFEIEEHHHAAVPYLRPPLSADT
jgi:hypothetical protein